MEYSKSLNNDLLFVVCGPSGTGKGTLIQSLLRNETRVIRCPSWTTRPIRFGERNGIDYHFTDSNNFLNLLQEDDMVGAEQFGFLYGVRTSEIKQIWQDEHSALVESNLENLKLLRKCFDDVVSIFISPPSINILSERLYQRGREEKEEIVLRLRQADQMINSVFKSSIDYYIVNDDFQTCLNTLKSIVDAEFSRLR